MESIGGAACGDPVKLLRAYRKFHSGQVDFVDSRIKDLVDKGQSPKQ